MDRRAFITSAAGGVVGLAAIATGGAAQAATGGDSAATARKLAERFAATLSAHDIDAFAALFAEDYQQHQTLVAVAPPPATPVSAKQGAVRYFGARLKAFPDLAVTAYPVVASKGWLAANFVYSGTHRGEYLGIAPTGKHVTFNSTDILRIRHGLFAEHWGAADINGLIQQLKG
jgi:predicted ester cyclase